VQYKQSTGDDLRDLDGVEGILSRFREKLGHRFSETRRLSKTKYCASHPRGQVNEVPTTVTCPQLNVIALQAVEKAPSG
jgi:hypothetical protein